MESHHEALDHFPCDKLDSTQLREGSGVEKVGASAGAGIRALVGHERQGSYRAFLAPSTGPQLEAHLHRPVSCVISPLPVSSHGDAMP